MLGKIQNICSCFLATTYSSGAKIDDHNSIAAQYFGLSGLPALHPWGKEDIFSHFV